MRLLLTLPVSITAAGPLTQLIPYLHTFTIVSLLLALMADLCNMETSRADAHKSGVSMQHAANTLTTSTPCVSLHRAPCTQDVIFPDILHSGTGKPRTLQQWKKWSRPLTTTSPPPVFEISSRNRFAPLRETGRTAVIVGDSIVRHVHATLAKGKVHTYCFPGARVLDVSAQIPAILKGDESVGSVLLHAGVNDTKLR